MDYEGCRKQSLQGASAPKQNAVVGIHNSRGAGDAIAGYRDNDVTCGMVNGKHNNPAVQRPPQERRAAKASTNVSWTQPQGRKLTLQ